MTPAAIRRRQAFFVLLLLAPLVGTVVDGWIRCPPRRLIDLFDDPERLAVEHVAVPLVAATILAGALSLGLWLGRPGVRRWTRSSGRKFALVLGVAAATWTVAEIAARVAESAGGQSGSTVHFGPGPTFDTYHRWLQEGPTPGANDVNRHRFRGPDLSETKPAGTLRVFALGGPNTWLDGLPLEATWPARLGERLTAGIPARRVEVQNASYRHWTSQHSLIYYVGRVQDFDPDIVVQMHGLMDCVYGYYNPETLRHPFDRAYAHNYGPLAHLIKSRYAPEARLTVWDHSRAVWWARQFLRTRLYGPPPPAADDLAVVPPDSQPPGPVPSLWCYERNVRTLATLLAAQGRRLVLVTEPSACPAGEAARAVIRDRFGALYHFESREEVTPDEFLAGLRAFNDATRRLSREVGAPLVDLDAALSGRADCFADPWTLNARGCDQAAERIAQAVQPLILN